MENINLKIRKGASSRDAIHRISKMFFAFSTIFFAFCLSSVFAQKPVDLVYPQLDAANSRWIYFNSASRPFGMVSLSPDTKLEGTWGSGYVYDTLEIKGFSHVHAWQLAGLSVMPVVSDKHLTHLKRDYYSAFSHDDEIVSPGYHKVELQRYGITAELTSTARAGFHRYNYTTGGLPKVLINLGTNLGPSIMTDARIVQVDNFSLKGFVVNAGTLRRPENVKLYFYIRFDTPIEQMDVWSGIRAKQEKKRTSGKNAGALVTFPEFSGQPLLMKVGISYVSIKQAKLNLETEIPDWNFDAVVTESKIEWNDLLSRIRISGGSQQAHVRFYTDLWHSLLGRKMISDVNGKYADYTGFLKRNRKLPKDDLKKPLFNHYNSDAFWGAQWNLNTLWHLVYPEVTSEFCNSLLQYYKDGGLIPRGPSGGNYTYVMTGASSTPFIVSAYMKGIRDFDINLAYEGLKKNHMPGGIMSKAGYEHGTSVGGGLENYIKLGYAPYPFGKKIRAYHLDGAGQTLEYAYQDWTLAQLAAELGKTEDHEYFLERSLNYQNLYDKQSGFMRPRDRRGDWKRGFDPYEYANGFVESNAAQATWFVPHDYDGLAKLMGGRDILVARLDSAFREASKFGFTSGKSHSVETRKELSRIPINYGNQPSMQTAFIFNVAGAPYLTQKWSRAVVDSVYSKVSPYDGYNGDEDQGQMGALAVLMKIGLFQLDGGTTSDPIYQIGSPVFDRIEIDLNPEYFEGGKFVIETINNSKENIYIKSVILNGRPLDRFYLKHSEIVNGGRLVLEMTSEANH